MKSHDGPIIFYQPLRGLLADHPKTAEKGLPPTDSVIDRLNENEERKQELQQAIAVEEARARAAEDNVGIRAYFEKHTDTGFDNGRVRNPTLGYFVDKTYSHNDHIVITDCRSDIQHKLTHEGLYDEDDGSGFSYDQSLGSGFAYRADGTPPQTCFPHCFVDGGTIANKLPVAESLFVKVILWSVEPMILWQRKTLLELEPKNFLSSTVNFLSRE